MKGLAATLLSNLWGFDGFILLCALANLLVYRQTRARISLIYEHFNAQDYTKNLDEEVMEALRQNTRGEVRALTAEELLKYREDANRWYAWYSNLSTMFPLLGMLGTVISLIPMVGAMGTEATGLFFSALTSTFWGIVAALLFKGLDATISYKIDDNEKHMEYLFNPVRSRQKVAAK